MDLKRKLHANLVEHIENRVPAIGKFLVAVLDHFGWHRWEHNENMPDRRTGEAGDNFEAKLGCNAGSILELLGSALAHTLGVAVAPDSRGKNALMAFVDDLIGDCLACEVCGQRHKR